MPPPTCRSRELATTANFVPQLRPASVHLTSSLSGINCDRNLAASSESRQRARSAVNGKARRRVVEKCNRCDGNGVVFAESQYPTRALPCGRTNSRGNVDTRLRKMAEGKWNATSAGIAAWIGERRGPSDWTREEFCPAAGQWRVGYETRKDDAVTSQRCISRRPTTRFAVTAERAALATLGGGCQVPIGIYCRTGLSEVTGSRPGVVGRNFCRRR